MKIDLYKTSSDNLRLDKSLTIIKKSVECHLKDDTSVFQPTFIVSESNLDNTFSTFNYLRSTDFGRYYFVTDVVMLTGHEVAIVCGKTDVLMSFKNYIRNSKGVIVRNEFVGATDIPDGAIEHLKNPTIIYKNFNASPFTPPADNVKCIAVTTTGGLN